MWTGARPSRVWTCGPIELRDVDHFIFVYFKERFTGQKEVLGLRCVLIRVGTYCVGLDGLGRRDRGR